MSRWCLALAVAALMVSLALPAGVARAAPKPGSLPTRARLDDWTRSLDVNRVLMRVANNGMLPMEPGTGDAGTLYPRENPVPVLYCSGLWLGGTVAGAPRVTVAQYTSEYAPGGMPGGVPDDPSRPEHVVYKVARWTGAPADSAHVTRSAAEMAAAPKLDPLVHHSWSEYMAGAAPHGAPWRTYRLPDTSTPAAGDSVDVPGPDVRGDQMLWCVYNDADPARHTSSAGSTAPLGVEVRQTVFAYDRPGPLGNTVFVRYEVFNRGGNSIPDLRAALWSDPDVGFHFHDDLTGSDTTRSLGYAYNTPWGQDPAFGGAKPAVGFDLLDEHDSPALLRPSGMDAFVEWVNGSDPHVEDEFWMLLCGLDRFEGGAPFIDPNTGLATPFLYPGDPATGTGWLDPIPSNVKTLVSSGPHEFPPGDTLVFWVAVIVGQGPTPVASLLALRCASDDVQDVFDAGFAEPFAAPRACEFPAVPCPRGADWWAAHCAAGDMFTPAQWEAIALWADSVSANLIPTPPPRSGPFCQSVGWQGSTRDSAMHEYLGLLANAAAAELGLVPNDGSPIGLPLETGLLVPPLTGGVARGLFRHEDVRRGIIDGTYLNDVTDHQRALAGVDFGLPFFGGGAGAGRDFLGSTLDPATMPDSFSTVELRFSSTATQKAYRFLRKQQADGSAPAGGPAYAYGGHHPVNLQAWDLDSGAQLDLAFVERTVTAPDGTILGAGSQPATFDSTWRVTDDPLGDREYLFVMRRPYSDAPKPEIAQEGAIAGNLLPVMYALLARLRAATHIIDDGDGFRFVVGWPKTGSADALLVGLAAATPADTQATRLYRELTASLRELNLGLGIGPVCQRLAPFAATLVEATVQDWHVQLRWRLEEPATLARVEYRTEASAWLDAGPATLGSGGFATAEFIGAAYPGPLAVRLAVAVDYGVARSDSVWLDRVASRSPAAMAVFPNPASSAPRLTFTLPSSGAARLEVYDLSGRRVSRRELGTLPSGSHLVEIAPGRRLRPGVYFVTLRFGGARRTARFVAL